MPRATASTGSLKNSRAASRDITSASAPARAASSRRSIETTRGESEAAPERASVVVGAPRSRPRVCP